MHDELTYPFPHFNDFTVEVWECMINFTPHFIMDVIIYPCCIKVKPYLQQGLLEFFHGRLARFAGCACAWNTGKVFPATAVYRSRHASGHVLDARAMIHAEIANNWFSLKSVAEKTFPAFPVHAQPAILRIWQEVQVMKYLRSRQP